MGGKTRHAEGSESGPDRLKARCGRTSHTVDSICMMLVIIWLWFLRCWYFRGNSLSFGRTVLDFVLGTSDDHGKAKA